VLRLFKEKAKTHVRVGTLVGSRTGKCDELMAPFVDHKTAHWEKKRERTVLQNGFMTKQHAKKHAKK